MTKLLETLKNINLKEIVKDAMIENGAQVIKCEQWLDLDYDHRGNTFNGNAPLVINIKTIFAADESNTCFFNFPQRRRPARKLRGRNLYFTR